MTKHKTSKREIGSFGPLDLRFRISLGFRISSFGFLVVLAAAQAATRPVRADDPADAEQWVFRAAVDRVAPSVVRIETIGGAERVGRLLFGVGPTTGLVLTSDGYIVSSAFNFVNRPARNPGPVARRQPQGRQARGHRPQPHGRAVEDRAGQAAGGRPRSPRPGRSAWANGRLPWGGRSRGAGRTWRSAWSAPRTASGARRSRPTPPSRRATTAARWWTSAAACWGSCAALAHRDERLRRHRVV